MTDGDSGLRALPPETASLMPEILVRHEPNYVLVMVAGEVDYGTVAGLRERLFALAASGRHLVADLDRVSFIDAAGLGALAGAARQAAAHGGSLHVVCAGPQIRRLFGVTGLDRAVPLAGRLADALQEVTGADAAAV
jgi:anti-sigma B factor antagonist